MRIIHHFGLRITSESDARAFSYLGIHLERGPQNLPGSAIASFKISEDDPRWTEVRELAENHKVTDFETTQFSEAELLSASVLCMFVSLQRGFPSNADYWRFLEETYDLSNYCLHCGVGLEQVRPFRAKPLKDLNREVWQLNWVDDEFLVTRDVWTSTFEPFGIECRPVLSAKTGAEIDSIVQLRISRQTPLMSEDLSAIPCPHCSRKKAPLTLRGFAPAPVHMGASISKSTDYFGTGANAFHRIFVSDSLYREIRSRNLRGVEFYPCQPSTSSDSNLHRLPGMTS
jgi:hypothetical protein